MAIARTFAKTLLLSAAGVFLFGVQAPVPRAQATDEADTIFVADAAGLTDGQMGELRGGFMDPSGLFLRFAVDVRTLVGGSLLFIRSLVLQPDVNGALQATSSHQILPIDLPDGMAVAQINDGKGITITDAKGHTTAINQTANGTFANVILNNATGRNVTQNMDIHIVLRHMQNVSGAAFTSGGAVAGLSALAQTARTHAAGLRF